MKNLAKIGSMFLTLTFMTSCATQPKIVEQKVEIKPALPPIVSVTETPPTEEAGLEGFPPKPAKAVFDECSKKGGHMSREGMAGGYMCVITYADAGKTCNDGKDCQSGACIADTSEKTTAGWKFNGTEKVKGICKSTNNPFSCYTFVRDGKLSDGICVD